MSGKTDGGILGALGDGVGSLLGGGQSTTTSVSSLPQTSASTSTSDTAVQSTTSSTPTTTSATSATTSLLESVTSLVSSTSATTSPPVTEPSDSASSSSVIDSASEGQSPETSTAPPTTLATSTLGASSVAIAEEATPTPSATLHNASEQSAHKSSGGLSRTMTAVAIAAPIGGLVLIGLVLLMYKKRGWLRRRMERRGTRLDDDDVQSLRYIQQQEKFDPARNY